MKEAAVMESRQKNSGPSYRDDGQLDRIKSDSSLILNALGLERGGKHCPCPFCKSSSALSVGPNDKGIWLFKCHGCETKGTVIDALALLDNKSVGDVIKELCPRSGNQTPPPTRRRQPLSASTIKSHDSDKKDPVIDIPRAEEFIQMAHANLTENESLQARWMTKRGLTIDVVEFFRIGFIESHVFKDYQNPKWHHWTITNSWVLPITDKNGKLKGVKLHRENPPEGAGKSLWAPFGLDPKPIPEKDIWPRHGLHTLWPHPERAKAFVDFKRAKEGGGTQVAQSASFTDTGYWLNRATMAQQEKVHHEAELEKLARAAELRVKVENLPDADLAACIDKAFKQFASEIKRGILKRTNALPSVHECASFIYVMPGELKALAILSKGLISCSGTGGESADVKPEFLEAFRWKSVHVEYDDDIAKINKAGKLIHPGQSFVRKFYRALQPIARDTRANSRGRSIA